MTKIIKEIIKIASYKILGVKNYEKVRFWFAHKKIINLEKPISFNEKICYRKIFNQDPRFPVVADKFLVRDFVRDKVGEKYLSKVFAVFGNIDQVNFDVLPERFVVKSTNGSGSDYILIVDDKKKWTKEEFFSEIENFFNTAYGKLTNEWWYEKIQPCIIIEERLFDLQNEIPLDYKFFVFHGRVEYIQVDYSRFTKHLRTFYDLNWMPQEFTLKYPKGKISEKPNCLEEMIKVAEILGNDFDFIRVDLYCLQNSRIVFGEMTLAPEAGWGNFSPKEWDINLGQLW